MADIIITLTRRWPHAVEVALQKQFTVRLNPDDHVFDRDEIISACDGVTVLCPTITDEIDAALIERLPDSVRLIACFGAGIERVDVRAARHRGIVVSNTPGAVVEDTADLAFGLILAASRRFSEAESLLRLGGWHGFSLDQLLGRSVHGKILGIIGLGKIGTAVAARARGFGMRVIYHNRNRRPEAEAQYNVEFFPDLGKLLAEADIVSLHCPLTPATHHLIDAAAIKQMKPGMILVNTSRGPVIHEEALVAALQEGPVLAAGLDVYEFEPGVSETLRSLPNTVLLPHIGTATREARTAMGMRVLDNIVAFLQTGKVRDEVKG